MNNDIKEKPQYKVITHNAKPERRVVRLIWVQEKKYSREGEDKRQSEMKKRKMKENKSTLENPLTSVISLTSAVPNTLNSLSSCASVRCLVHTTYRRLLSVS